MRRTGAGCKTLPRCRAEYRTRYWGIYVDGELLAVVLYRKGAVAIADMLVKIRTGKASDAA